MKLIAKKPCSFGGKKFYIGESIPAEYVINPKDQEKMGVLTIVDGDYAVGGTPAASHVILNAKTQDGHMALDLTVEGVQEIFDILAGNVEEGEAIVETMTDEEALILLHIIDGRKSIKAAAEARAKALNEVPEEEETSETPEESEDEIPEESENPETPEESEGEQ